MSLGAELLINKRALIVSYNGELFFPTYGSQISGRQFGLNYDYEVDYRSLKKKFQAENSENWVLMPLVPYDPYEMDYAEKDSTGFSPPSFSKRTLLWNRQDRTRCPSQIAFMVFELR